jgi:hypothetical protein
MQDEYPANDGVRPHCVCDTVALAQAGLPRIGVTPRPSQTDPYLPLIRETLEKFPSPTGCYQPWCR